MRNKLWFLAAAGVWAAAGAVVWAAGAAAPAKTDKPVAPAKTDTKAPAAEPPPKPAMKVPPVASFIDDAKALAGLALGEDQRKGLLDAREARDRELAQWDQANEKAVAALRERMTKVKGASADVTRKRLQGQLDTLFQARARIAATHERKMFGLLTDEQKGKYNGPPLARGVQKELGSIRLDEAQSQQLLELCHAQGRLIAEPVGPATHAAVVKGLAGQAVARILTAEQKKLYNELKNANKPPHKTTPPKAN